MDSLKQNGNVDQNIDFSEFSDDNLNNLDFSNTNSFFGTADSIDNLPNEYGEIYNSKLLSLHNLFSEIPVDLSNKSVEIGYDTENGEYHSLNLINNGMVVVVDGCTYSIRKVGDSWRCFGTKITMIDKYSSVPYYGEFNLKDGGKKIISGKTKVPDKMPISVHVNFDFSKFIDRVDEIISNADKCRVIVRDNKELSNIEEKPTIEDMTNKAIGEVFKEIVGTPIVTTTLIPIAGGYIIPIRNEDRDIDTEKDFRNQRGEIKYDKERSTLKSRGNETKIEKILENGTIKIEGLDFDIPLKEGIRLLNFKNWIKYMKKTERKKDNQNIIYSGMDKKIKGRMQKNTFYNNDGTKLLDSDTIENYCPTISKDETKMKEIEKWLNINIPKSSESME